MTSASAPFLAYRQHFGGQYSDVRRAGVAPRPEQSRIPEAGGAELIEEGHAFLGTGHSSKPIIGIRCAARRSRLT